MQKRDPVFKKLIKSPEQSALELQYLRLCGVYDGDRIKEFVYDFKINPNATDRYKNNALIYALRPISYGVNKLDTIKTLCKMGVSPMRQNIFGFSPVAMASLAPESYGFCSLNPSAKADFCIMLDKKGNYYHLSKKIPDKKSKRFDFPYPSYILDLPDRELELLNSNALIDVSLKKYNLKLLQYSWFAEALTVLQDNFKSIYTPVFLSRYIEIYRKKRIKLIVWGFGDDPLESEEQED